MRKNQTIINIDKDLNIKFGTIISINTSKRATVRLNDDTVLEDLEFFYHCLPDNVEDGDTAFVEEDRVIIAEVDTKYFIIGFEDLKPRPCVPKRFFAKTNKGYFWIIFNTDDGFEIEVREAHDKEFLDAVTEIPEHSDNASTKSFMLEKDGVLSRYTACLHMLIKNRKEIFAPLHYPETLIDCPEKKTPEYPTPALCGDPPKVRLKHYCPPNRFFYNDDEKMMVWFTAKNNNPEIVGNDYICGITLNLEDDEIEYNDVNHFTYTPTDGGLGFEPYWCVNRTGGEVPVAMMIEVEKLTKNEIHIIMPWEHRPVKIKKTFNGGIVYEEINSCYHQYWSKDGTEKKLFATLDQTIDTGGGADEESVQVSEYDCSQHTTPGECSADNGHAYELKGKRTWDGHSADGKKHSNYTTNIFDQVLNANSDYEKADENEYCREYLRKCYFHTSGYCFSFSMDLYKHRSIDALLNQKNLNSGHASWINPNIAFRLRDFTKEYCQGEAIQFGSSSWIHPSHCDFEDLCHWTGFTMPHWQYDLMSFPCFFGKTEMPGDIWNRLDSESKYIVSGGMEWKRSTNQDEESYSEIDKYIIDGVIELEKDNITRLYYLDDRSTEDSQGIMVGATGKDVNDNAYYWKVYWATDLDYVDITTEILTALDCELCDLKEIGLV